MEIIGIIILIFISLIVLKKSFDWGILPYALIVIFGVFGLLFKGFYGLLLGLVGGYIISILLGSLSGIGLFKKKDRKLMAGKFVQDNRNEVLKLEKFKKMNDKEIINILANILMKFMNFLISWKIQLKDTLTI